MNEQDTKKVVEAVLFASPDILTIKQISAILGGMPGQQLKRITDELNEEYEKTSRTFRILRIGEGYQMRTLPMYKTWITKAEPLKPIKLTQPALETLAIVAYRQPVTRADVEHLRGVDCSGSLRRLLELRLLRIAGKDTAPGRPILYATTRDFLSLFNLRDLRELPTLEEFDLPVKETVQQELIQDVG
ncbi:MAG: SMC-Scp complex subunit ScpB [Deltaproteobacteria bacterium]|nr:SMC-Scp complex subunit ScpB [Deltaproteobacteria bacterium]